MGTLKIVVGFQLTLNRMGWHWNLSTARSDVLWRLERGLLERGLRPGAAASYRPLIQAKAHALLSRLLAKPNQWEAHIELSVGHFFAYIVFLNCLNV